MGKTKTNEQFVKEIYDIVKDEYVFLAKYIGVKTKIKCRHNKCGHIWEVRPDSFLSGSRCPKCIGNKKKTNREFAEEVHVLVGNEYVFLENYINSNTKIKCRHNNCGHTYSVSPNAFLTGCRCPECNKIQKSNEQFKKEAFDLVGDEYEFLESYTGVYNKIKCKHNVCGYEWRVIPNGFLNNNTRCPRCFGGVSKNISQFNQEVFDLVGNEYEFLDEYINAKTKIKCKHNECGHTYNVSPNNFLKGRRCPRCFGSHKKNTDIFKKEVYDLVNDEYSVVGKYVGAKTKVKLKHNICANVYGVTPSDFLNGRRCPQCSESKGEQAVRIYLENKNIKFQQEYIFEDLLSDKDFPLRFDFAVFDNKDSLIMLVEYDGIFHYEEIYRDGRFKKQQFHDQLKNQYCKDNDIPLLRIPYWKFDNIEDIFEEFIVDYGLFKKENKKII